MTRKPTTSSCIALMVLVSAVLCMADRDQDPRLITVTGDAEVKVAPDKVILAFGIETFHSDIDKAKLENDKRSKKVLAIAGQHGVDKKYVQTEYLNIDPQYDHRYKRTDVVSYVVRNTIALTLTDLSKFEDLLTSLLKAGANRIHGVRFETGELPKHKREARKLAIQAARQKALEMGREMGVRVGKPYRIDESTSYSPWFGQWRGSMPNVVRAAEALSATNSSLAPGQVSVTAKVTVSFEIQ